MPSERSDVAAVIVRAHPYYFPFCRGAPHAEVGHSAHPRGWMCDCPCHGGLNDQWWSDNA
jgi:hypothetical protein